MKSYLFEIKFSEILKRGHKTLYDNIVVSEFMEMPLGLFDCSINHGKLSLRFDPSEYLDMDDETFDEIKIQFFDGFCPPEELKFFDKEKLIQHGLIESCSIEEIEKPL